MPTSVEAIPRFRKDGKRAQRIRDEHIAWATSTFHQPQPGAKPGGAERHEIASPDRAKQKHSPAFSIPRRVGFALWIAESITFRFQKQVLVVLSLRAIGRTRSVAGLPRTRSGWVRPVAPKAHLPQVINSAILRARISGWGSVTGALPRAFLSRPFAVKSREVIPGLCLNRVPFVPDIFFRLPPSLERTMPEYVDAPGMDWDGDGPNEPPSHRIP